MACRAEGVDLVGHRDTAAAATEPGNTEAEVMGREWKEVAKTEECRAEVVTAMESLAGTEVEVCKGVC